MKREALMVLEDELFSTMNVLTQLMRLQQVVAGSLRNEGRRNNHIKEQQSASSIRSIRRNVR